MANLDGGAAPGADADASSSTKDVFDPNALNFNLKNIDKIRSFMGIVSGCVAGILGITGILPGLGESFVVCVLIRCCRLPPSRSLLYLFFLLYYYNSLFSVLTFIDTCFHLGI